MRIKDAINTLSGDSNPKTVSEAITTYSGSDARKAVKLSTSITIDGTELTEKDIKNLKSLAANSGSYGPGTGGLPPPPAGI